MTLDLLDQLGKGPILRWWDSPQVEEHPILFDACDHRNWAAAQTFFEGRG
jgi:hypothetical protein